MVKRSSSILTPSHDCLCTKVIVVVVVVESVGFTFLERLSLALSRCCSASFLCRRVFYTFTRSHARYQDITQHSLAGIRDASFGSTFYALSRQDVVGDAHAGLQRSLSQSHCTSLDEWHGAAQQTSEQTT